MSRILICYALRIVSHVPLESAVAKRILVYLRARGCWAIKTTGVSLVGCPDILACYRGYFLAIEVKREQDGAYGVTKKQEYELTAIGGSGGGWVVASTVKDVEELINIIDERERQWY